MTGFIVRARIWKREFFDVVLLQYVHEYLG